MFFIAEKTGNFSPTCGKHNVSEPLWWFLRGGDATPLGLWCVLFEVAGTVWETQLRAPYAAARRFHKQLRDLHIA